jgi:hypothetical protein
MKGSDVGPKRRTGARWWTGFGALALALVVTASSPGVAPLPTPIHMNGRWSTQNVDGLISMSVPSDWNVAEGWIMPGSFADLVGSLSNQLLSPPCTTSGNSITCGPPVTSLQPGAVLVDVYNGGNPLWTLSSQPGTPTVVSGWSARVTVQTGSQSSCSGLGADRSWTEFIAPPSPPDDYYEVSICSRGVPAAVGARVLASVRVILND